MAEEDVKQGLSLETQVEFLTDLCRDFNKKLCPGQLLFGGIDYCPMGGLKDCPNILEHQWKTFLVFRTQSREQVPAPPRIVVLEKTVDWLARNIGLMEACVNDFLPSRVRCGIIEAPMKYHRAQCYHCWSSVAMQAVGGVE